MTAKALSTTSQIEFIDKKKFAKIAIDENFETFVKHMSVLNDSKLAILLF